MLQDINLVWVIMPFMIGAILYPRIVKHHTGDPLRDKLKDMQVMMIIFGVMLGVLWLCMPSTPSLSTFGYPETVEDIKNPEKLLKLLQKYNKAIVRTTEAVYWFLFLMTFWFIGSMYQLMKVMMLQRDKEMQAKYDEKTV